MCPPTRPPLPEGSLIETPSPLRREVGPWTAALLVVASMIGAGVFTTTGLLVRDLGSPAAVLLAWLVGGVAAVCGALAYGQLGAAMPENGGEYWLLSRLYHPAIGFAAGFVSMVVGFSAPIAASALAFGVYLERLVPALPAVTAGVVLVVGMTGLHAAGVSLGSRVQNVLTALQALLITLFIGASLVLGDTDHLVVREAPPLLDSALSPVFAVGILYVSFSYSGWNAAIYVAGEVRAPERTLPKALLAGTLAVVVLYLGLNLAFLVAAPMGDLSGVVDVAHVAAAALFGTAGGVAVSIIIALGLATTVGAVVLTGARVFEAMGRDHSRLALLSRRGEKTGPFVALCAQGILALAMLLTASFDALLTYMGFTLALSSTLCIGGLFRLRRDQARAARRWGHPFTTSVAIALSVWMMVFSVFERPVAVLWGLGTVVAGLVLYAWVRLRHEDAE